MTDPRGGWGIPRISPPPSVGFGDGGSPSAGSGSGVSSIFPPNLYPPQGSTIVLKMGRGAVTAIAPTVTPAGLSFTVPMGQVLMLDSLSALILAPLDTSDVTWQILINGNPAPLMPAIFSPQMRAASSLEQPFGPLGLQVNEGYTVSVSITTNDAQPYTVSAQWFGWFFGRSLLPGGGG